MVEARTEERPAGRRAWRRPVAALALAGAVLTGAAACGDGAGDGGKGGGSARTDGRASGAAPGPSGASTASGASGGTGALTLRDLTALAFTDGERMGKYAAAEMILGTPIDEDYTADPAVCQPFVSLTEGATAFDPVSEVNREVSAVEDMWGGTMVDVQLRSYDGDEAASVMKAIGAAEKACAGGFVEERALAEGQYLKAEPVPAPDVGDEARAYRFTILDVKGRLKLYEYLTVVRSGPTTLSFRAETLDTKDFGGVPDEVVAAQWKKFEAAATD